MFYCSILLKILLTKILNIVFIKLLTDFKILLAALQCGMNSRTVKGLQRSSNILKNEAAKYVIIPTKLAPNIYQILKSAKDKMDPMETSEICRIEYNKDYETGY